MFSHYTLPTEIQTIDDAVLQKKIKDEDAINVNPDNFLILHGGALVTYDVEACVAIVLMNKSNRWRGLYHMHAADFTHEDNTYRKKLHEYFWEYSGISQASKDQISLYAIGGDYERITDAGNDKFIGKNSENNHKVRKVAKKWELNNQLCFIGDKRLAKDVLVSYSGIYVAEKPIQEHHDQIPHMTADQYLEILNSSNSSQLNAELHH